jgi:subtilisin family serine protease
MKKRSLLTLIITALCATIATSTVHGTTAGEGDFAPGVVLVKFNAQAGPRAVRRLARAYKLKQERRFRRIGVHRFRIPSGKNVRTMCRVLERYGIVDFAEPDYLRSARLIPNDTLFANQWGLNQIGMQTVWDLELGSPSVVTAIIDTGIDLDHPDLMSQLWINSDELAGNNVDDDNNGYVDDVVGYDFAGDGAVPPPGREDPVPDDSIVGHGTHVSGTVAGKQNNNQGITGIAPGTKVMAVRALGGALGTAYTSDLLDGIAYAVDNGAHVINMSLGGTGKSLSEYLAVQDAWENNVFIAAAAGNSGDTGNPIEYPAAFVFSMSVGANDINENIASFSTHNSFVEIAAPGVQIMSTVPDGLYEQVGWSGTSMATPHVAGVAALLYSHYPGIANWEVRAMLQNSAVDRGAAGWDEFFGFGRLSASDACNASRPDPGTLQILTPPPGGVIRPGSIVSILWNPVTNAANYQLRVTLPNGAQRVIPVSSTHYTVDPRTVSPPAGGYSVTVEALNGGGAVIASDSVDFSIQ